MKILGLIGGMSWESTAEYYRIINEAVRAALGPLHSARCLLFSVDFAEIEHMQRENRWDEAGEVLADAARRLERGGAGLIVLCTNTMHKLAPQIEAASGVRLLHIADATARNVSAAGIRRIGLLGTRYTMEEGFYKDRLEQSFGLEVLIPPPEERRMIHRVIFEELVLGELRAESRAAYRRSIHALAARGAQGIILGCTEIGLLVSQEDSPVTLFDTTRIHAEAAAAWLTSP